MGENQTAVCTICSKNYLHFARTLMESSIKHHPDWDHYVLLVDEDLGLVDPDREVFNIITLNDLKIPNPRKFFFRYTILELNTAVKPWLLEQLFASDYQHVLYLDPDIYVYSRMKEVEDALNSEHTIVLTPHLTQSLDDDHFPNDLIILQAGSWNLGFIALRRCETTQTFLKWWQAKLEYHCVVDFSSGRFVDQKWIDLVPGMYQGVSNLRHEGYNVAYWNLPHREVTRVDNGYAINGQSLRFMHFSGLDPLAPERFSKYQNRLSLSNVTPTLREIVLQYCQEVLDHGYEECRTWSYTFNKFEDGAPIHDAMRIWYRQNEKHGSLSGADPFKLGAKFFNRPCEKLPQSRHLITEFMYLMWSSRPDVQAVFPTLEPVNAMRFAEWFLFDPSNKGLPAVYTDPVRQVLCKPADLSGPARVKRNVARFLPKPVKAVLRRLTPRRVVATIFPERIKAPLRSLIDGTGRKTVAVQATSQSTAAPEPRPSTLSSRIGSIRLAPSYGSKPFGLNVVGYLRNELGIGQSGRLCAFSAKAAQIPLALIEHSAGCSSRANDCTFQPSEIQKDNPYSINLIHVNADQFPILESSLGSEFDMERYNIGYWHWELPEFPDDWIPSFDLVNEIWAPTQFVADAIADKSPVPVVRIPHAIGFDVSPNASRGKFGLPADKFLFLFQYDMFSFQERKNPLACIEAFRKAFGKSSNVALVIKTQNASYNMDLFHELERSIEDLPHSVVIDATLSRAEVYELQSVCDCFISLHRSEGFGLGLAECMFLGKPTIATNWSGNIDFMNPKNSCLVDYHLIPLDRDYGPYNKGQHWADPDIDHAAWYMKRLVEDRSYYKQIGEAGRQTMVSEYSYSAIGNRYRKRLSNIVKLYGIQPELNFEVPNTKFKAAA